MKMSFKLKNYIRLAQSTCFTSWPTVACFELAGLALLGAQDFTRDNNRRVLHALLLFLIPHHTVHIKELNVTVKYK